MKTPWSILERERNTGRGKYSSDAWLGREQPDMLQYHADFVSSVTMLLCNYISPILASYFVTRVLRNEREKKKISLLSTLLLPCRDNVNVFILFSHSETQTRASLSLSSSTQLHSRIALTETIYSQLSRNYLENLHLDILILARASSLNFPFPREESEESSMRNEMKNQRECTSFPNIDPNLERERIWGRRRRRRRIRIAYPPYRRPRPRRRWYRGGISYSTARPRWICGPAPFQTSSHRWNRQPGNRRTASPNT